MQPFQQQQRCTSQAGSAHTICNRQLQEHKGTRNTPQSKDHMPPAQPASAPAECLQGGKRACTSSMSEPALSSEQAAASAISAAAARLLFLLSTHSYHTHLRGPASRQALCRPPGGAPEPQGDPARGNTFQAGPSHCDDQIRAIRSTTRTFCPLANNQPTAHLQNVGDCHFKLPPLLRHPSCRQRLLLLQASCSRRSHVAPRLQTQL